MGREMDCFSCVLRASLRAKVPYRLTALAALWTVAGSEGGSGAFSLSCDDVAGEDPGEDEDGCGRAFKMERATTTIAGG